MKKYLVIITLLFIISSCVQVEPSSTDVETLENVIQGETTSTSTIVKPADYEYPKESTFKVLSWNVEHFLDQYDDPYIINDREDNPPENMQLRRKLLIDAFKKADADVVVLQEFESVKYLQRIAKDSLTDMGYIYFAEVPSPTWYMNVVLMSRFPLGVIRGYGNVTTPLVGYLDEDGQPETQNRINTRMWSITIYPSDDYTFTLAGLHLKAGRGPRNIAMRKGQIKFLLSEFDELINLNNSQNIMVAGDLNATPQSEELHLFKNHIKKNKFTDPVDTAILSHPADAPSRRLDYILLNENMLKEMVTDSVRVEYFYSPDTMRIVSDHLPLVGTFYNNDN